MKRQTFQRLALVLFCIYLMVFPGSTLTIALDRVPAWGAWMGGALLMLQGAAVLCWLLGSYGRRGALAGLLVFLIAWGVEQIGVTTGFPFGRYHYTAALQPQLFGSVPLAIVSAWLIVAIGAWQLALTIIRTLEPWNVQTLVVAATLVLLLDLQIETIATAINRYWIWTDSGPYYSIPTANFVAWWLVGLGMACVLARLLPAVKDQEPRAHHQNQETSRQADEQIAEQPIRHTQYAIRVTRYALRFLPAQLYLLSTLMFAVVNLARGYVMAGLIGVGVLIAVKISPRRPATGHAPHQRHD